MRSERLAEKLRAIRLGLGLSQNELIKQLGLEDLIYQSNVSGYESGEREPPLPILLKYAEAAGVCLDVLANDDLDLPAKLPAKPKHTRGGLRQEEFAALPAWRRLRACDTLFSFKTA